MLTSKETNEENIDKSTSYNFPLLYVPGTDTTRIEVLKQYTVYDRQQNRDCPNEFVLGGKIPRILKKYRYREYINDSDSTNDETAFKLLDFVCDNFTHNGSAPLGRKRKISYLIKHHGRNGLSCRGLAILLASLLRLNGIKAQHITCLPYEEPCEECHVVVDCLLPSGKRIMLDPTYRMYLTDKNGDYVSIPRLRELLSTDEPVFENPDANYNGAKLDKGYYRNYMTKNTFRFARCTLNKDGVDGFTRTSKYIELIPKNYKTDTFAEGYAANFVYNDIEFWKM